MLVRSFLFRLHFGLHWHIDIYTQFFAIEENIKARVKMMEVIK